MAKQKDEAVATAENNLPATIEVDGKLLSIEQTAAALKQMKPTGEELTSDYFTLEPGEPAVKCIFVGTTTMKSRGPEGGEVTAIKFLTEDGRMVVNGDVVIVGAMKDQPLMTAVEIECIGTTKSGRGTYRNFNIRKLG